MTNQTELSPGSVLQGGKYKIEAVLGQGGFGITYLAEQVSLDRKVAIKEFFMREYCNRDLSTSYVFVQSVGSNVGASSPSDYGDYYAWGEIELSIWQNTNSITYEKTMGDISGNSNYDVARKTWGGTWRLPTQSECEELESKCNCQESSLRVIIPPFHTVCL